MLEMVQITCKRLSKVVNYTSVCHSNPRMYRNNTMGHCIHQMGFYSSWTGRPETCRCGFVGRYPPSNCRDSLIWSHWFFHNNPLRLLFSCSFLKNHSTKEYHRSATECLDPRWNTRDQPPPLYHWLDFYRSSPGSPGFGKYECEGSVGPIVGTLVHIL